MHVMNQTVLGALIILLLATLVVIKRVTTGSILEKPNPGFLLWLVNIFNLFFLLIANPLAAILLVTGRINGFDPTSLEITPGWLLRVVELLGLVIYLAGFFLMGWALIRLGKNYQLGGSDPRTGDRMIVSGPYGIIRHPMYTAALSIAFGLACLTGSLACLGAFIIYLVLIILLIPIEEESLMEAYGEEYGVYRRKTGKLIPVLR
jgi:protein-S-isoprenylcysteine O-methyltransferase Ste14